MRYDTQVIYSSTNKNTFSFNEWIYYKTPKGKTKRQNAESKKIESVNPETWQELRLKFESIFGYKILDK